MISEKRRISTISEIYRKIKGKNTTTEFKSYWLC